MPLDHLKRRPANAVAATPPEPEAPEKKKLKAVVVGKWSCGHDATAKHLNRPCGRCTDEARAKVYRDRRAKRVAAAKPVRNCDSPGAPAGRLPDGATFLVTYDAATKSWTGSLVIPSDAANVAYAGNASGVFRLLAALDAQYRASL